MTVSNVFSRYAVRVFPDGVSDTLIGGITEQSTPIESEVRRDRASGDVYGRHIALVRQAIRASFTTYQLARALDVCGLLGLKLSSSVNPGLELFSQKWNEGGTPVSGASHMKYTIKEGLLVPRMITASHQQDATISYEALATWDGANNPVVVGNNVSLPSGVTDDQRFALGKFTLGGIAVGQLTNLEIDFGIVAETVGADSDVWDSFARIVGVEPTVRLRGSDLTVFDSSKIPLTGKLGVHADTVFYLRKRQDGSTYVPEATAEHIKCTANGLATITGAANQSGDQPSEIEIEMPLRYDGTNVPLVIDTASAIT